MGLLVLLGFSLVGAWNAIAQSVVTPTTPNPLPGSQFQGGDGNQGDAPGLIDWEGLQASGRFGHTSDPQANDDIFAGGDKELEPGGWGLTTSHGERRRRATTSLTPTGRSIIRLEAMCFCTSLLHVKPGRARRS